MAELFLCAEGPAEFLEKRFRLHLSLPLGSSHRLVFEPRPINASTLTERESYGQHPGI